MLIGRRWVANFIISLFDNGKVLVNTLTNYASSEKLAMSMVKDNTFNEEGGINECNLIVTSTFSEYGLQIGCMFFMLLGFHDHVVHVNF